MPPSPLPTPANEPSLPIIFAIVVGAGAVIGIATGIFLYIMRARKNKGSQELSMGRFSHKHANSDTSVSPLLYTKTLGTADERSRSPNSYSLTPFDNQMQKRNISTDSLETVKPMQDDRYSVPSSDHDEGVPLISEISHASERTVTPLIIPSSSSPYVPPDPMADNSPYSYAPSSAGSASSVSLYSQASALSREPTSKFQLMPPMIPQYTQDEGDNKAEHPPTRSGTIVVAKLLKERAKRNPNKIDRSVSRIERIGSIRSVTGEDDNEEERYSAEKDGSGRKRRQPSRRPRESEPKPESVATLVPMSTSAADPGPTPSSRSSSFSTSTKRDAPTTPVIPLPPPTLVSTSLIYTPPPQRPHSFIVPPPRSSSRSVRQSEHTYSWSFGEQGNISFSQDLAPETAHVRRYSAERMTLNAVWPAQRNLPVHGVVAAV